MASSSSSSSSSSFWTPRVERGVPVVTVGANVGAAGEGSGKRKVGTVVEAGDGRGLAPDAALMAAIHTLPARRHLRLFGRPPDPVWCAFRLTTPRLRESGARHRATGWAANQGAALSPRQTTGPSTAPRPVLIPSQPVTGPAE